MRKGKGRKSKAKKTSGSGGVEEGSLIGSKQETKEHLKEKLEDRPTQQQLEERGIYKKLSKEEKRALKKQEKKKLKKQMSSRGSRRSSKRQVNPGNASDGGGVDKSIIGNTLGQLAERDGRPLPDLVTQCIPFIQRHALEQEGVFRLSGDANQIRALRTQFEAGAFTSFGEIGVHAVTGLLKLFFREMPEALFTFALHTKFTSITTDAQDVTGKIRSFANTLKELPRENLLCSQLLFPLLHETTLKSSVNKMEAQNIGIVFGPTLMRSKAESEGVIDMSNKSANTIEFIVKHWPNVERVLNGAEVELEEPAPTAAEQVAPPPLGAMGESQAANPACPPLLSETHAKSSPTFSTPKSPPSPEHPVKAQPVQKMKKTARKKRSPLRKFAKRPIKQRNSVSGAIMSPNLRVPDANEENRRQSAGEHVTPVVPVGQPAVALYDFAGDHTMGQVDLIKDAGITFLAEHPGGWATIVNSKGSTGYVPGSYIKK